jgi:hypothetical protein
MEEDFVVVHHVSSQEKEIREKIAEVKVNKPGILVVLTVVAYFIMAINLIVGVFMNIASFELITFPRFSFMDNVAFGIKVMTQRVNPIIMVMLALLPLFGLIGLFFTHKHGAISFWSLRLTKEKFLSPFKKITSWDKLGFWLFSLSQVGFLAIPLTIFAGSDHYGMIVMSLLHLIIIIPTLIAYFTYFYYFKKL